jgi:5-formyltetrahydrofolate cyclo-ligase
MQLTKATFREICFKKMKKQSYRHTLYKNYRVNKKLQTLLAKLLQKSRKKKILFYYPLQNEADIRKTLSVFRKKHQIFLPFMEGKSFKMVPFRLPLKRKKFGIYEAGSSKRIIKKIDIAIVPVLGIDKNLQRVGFGKGMYDRFFPTLQQKPFTIFVQLESCITKKRVCDTYDIDADVYISSSKTISNRLCKYKNIQRK